MSAFGSGGGLFGSNPTADSSVTNGLFARLARYASSGEFSDYSFHCQGHIFKVHRIIISAQSKVFEAAVIVKFKESTQNKMHFPEDDPAALQALIRGMYHNQYKNEGINGATIHPLVLDSQVYVLAEKYDVPVVKDVVLRQFCGHRTMTPIIYPKMVKEDVQALTEAVQIVWEGTPFSTDPLRGLLTSVVVSRKEELIDLEVFRSGTDNIPGFSTAVTYAMLTELSNHTYNYSSCNKTWTAFNREGPGPNRDFKHYPFCGGMHNSASGGLFGSASSGGLLYI